MVEEFSEQGYTVQGCGRSQRIIEELRERSMRKVEIQFDGPVLAKDFVDLPGVTDLRVDGSLLTCRLDGRADALVKGAARHTVVTLSMEEADLEELFFHYYDHSEEAGGVT